jgi:CheY-like chemotaxis protein
MADDEQDIADICKLLLEDEGHEVTIARDGQECIQKYNEELSKVQGNDRLPFDLAILDFRMPKKNRLEVAGEILAQRPRQPIIIAAANGNMVLDHAADEIKKLVEVLAKPFGLDEFISVINRKAHGNIVQQVRIVDRR